MEALKTKTILRKEKKNGRTHNFCLENIIENYCNQNSVLLANTDMQTNGTEQSAQK